MSYINLCGCKKTNKPPYCDGSHNNECTEHKGYLVSFATAINVKSKQGINLGIKV